MQRISLREFLHRVLRHLLVFSSKEVVNKAADGNVQDSARKRFQQLACKAKGAVGERYFLSRAACPRVPSCERY